jgi:tetratricopeptide (TPR) repeat protein
MTRQRAGCIILTVLAVSLPLSAADFNDIYGDAASQFDFLQDSNTGLTVFPILTIPLGGEYEGMGTAYTAVARDASFFDANPAASAMMKYTELSIMHNNWIADTNIEGIVYTNREDKWGYAFAGKFLYVPFTGYDYWGERNSAGYYSETIAIANLSRNFLADYYFNGISLGANLKAAYRYVSESIAAGQSAIGVMTDIGMLTRFDFAKPYYSRDKNAAFGLTIKNLGPGVMGEPLPMSVTAGIAYSLFRPWILALDVNVPFSFNPSQYPAEKPGGALGTSLALTNFFSVQAGFLVKGGNPRISLGSIVSMDDFGLVVNYTMDMTTQLSNLDRFSVAMKINLGDNGREDRYKRAEELYLAGIDFYARGDIADAIAYCERALDINPDFTPAQETINMARRSRDLQARIEELQKIE